MARKAILETGYRFTPSTNTIVIPRVILRERLILITNVTTNTVIYNFSDSNLKANTYTVDGSNYRQGVSIDEDTKIQTTAGARTTIVLSYNTSGMSSTDKLQIIVDEYDGFLPLEIKALPEGSIIKPHTMMSCVVATDDRFAWLASFIETQMIRAIWYPTTVATVSREAKKIIRRYLNRTSDDPQGQIPFKLHDFGARGTSSGESASIGGLAHLVNFMGTDTVEALPYAMEYYKAEGPVGFSIPASEHSAITSWGREYELDAYKNMIEVYGKDYKLIACVSDSYNIFNSVEKLWPALKDILIEEGITLVVRPDSGDPVEVTGEIIEILGEKFGYTVNSKGFKVLNTVRIIQGDGVNLKSIEAILDNFWELHWSADNIAFGMGGALLQKVNRDTLKFAQKTSAIEVDGKWIDVYKEPVNEPFKKSKKGRQITYKLLDDTFETMRLDEAPHDHVVGDAMQVVYRNGKAYNELSFDEVRKNAEVR